MNYFESLLTLNPDLGKNIVKYYNSKSLPLPITTFIKLPFEYQLGFLIDYFENQHNMHILVDLTNVVIHYVNPELNANEIIANYNKTGKWNDIILSESFKQSSNLLESYYLGFRYVINVALQPF